MFTCSVVKSFHILFFTLLRKSLVKVPFINLFPMESLSTLQKLLRRRNPSTRAIRALTAHSCWGLVLSSAGRWSLSSSGDPSASPRASGCPYMAHGTKIQVILKHGRLLCHTQTLVHTFSFIYLTTKTTKTSPLFQTDWPPRFTLFAHFILQGCVAYIL